MVVDGSNNKNNNNGSKSTGREEAVPSSSSTTEPNAGQETAPPAPKTMGVGEQQEAPGVLDLTGSTASIGRDEEDAEGSDASNKDKDKQPHSNEEAALDHRHVNHNTNTNEGEDEDEDEEDWALVVPGAVAVRGPSYRESSGDVDSVGWAARQAREADEDSIDSESPSPPPPIQVDSYAVPPSLTDEEIRRMILESAARAEVVVPIPEGGDEEEGGGGDDDDPSHSPHVNEDDDDPRGGGSNNKAPSLLASRRVVGIAIVAAIVVAAAIAVGVAVPLSAQSTSSPTAPADTPSGDGRNNKTFVDENLLASIKYFERQGQGGFAGAFQARNTLSPTLTNPVVSSGSVEVIRCGVKTCLEQDGNCLVGTFDYKPGCCSGADCPNETKCGEDCPAPPDSCYLTDPNNDTCVSSSCYTCHQEVPGQDTYVLEDHIWKVDCLEVGTATRHDNGLKYEWAIFCGPVIVGPIVEENRDLGEYQCAAARTGANYTDDSGGLLAAILPCQYIQLAECGCGPPDMYTFGLPAPTKPCVPGDGCPFLCEDAGKQYARELCRSFPGNISWWEGANAFESTLFSEDVMSDDYELEIYIKGER